MYEFNVRIPLSESMIPLFDRALSYKQVLYMTCQYLGDDFQLAQKKILDAY